jgi:3-hydroxyacyl-CoA dehydrogenase
MAYSKFADRVCELGRFGQKTGKGFYRYEPGNRKALPDPEIDALLDKYRKEHGLQTREISDEEIVERCIYALVNAGARILEEGIALRASDVDMVYLAGYGFPAHRGGPMFYADTVGLDKVVAAIAKFQKGYHGEQWQPAPLLVKLAKEGKRFN